MSTYGFADSILNGVNGAPIFTYGMICITAVVLSYITLIEPPEPKIEENILEPIAAATGIPSFEPFSSGTEESSSSPIPVFPGMEAPFSPESTAAEAPAEASIQETSIQETESSPIEALSVEQSPTEDIEVKKGGIKKKKKSRMHKPKEKSKRKTVNIRGFLPP